MADLELREGTIEPTTFTLSRNAVAYDLTGLEVRMRRRDGKNVDDVFATTDSSPLLVVTTAASGIVTFTPTAATTWEGNNAAYKYMLYFEVEVTTDNWYAWEEADNVSVTIVPKFID